MGYQHVILFGRGPDGNPTPVSVDADGNVLMSGGGGGGGNDGTPARTPLIATITLNSTAVELSTATPDAGESSHAGWRVIVPSGGAGILWGSEPNAVIPVAAGSDDVIPSASLAGWFAKSAGADVTITLVGAKDV